MREKIIYPCQDCKYPVPEGEELGDPNGEWLCPDCYGTRLRAKGRTAEII